MTIKKENRTEKKEIKIKIESLILGWPRFKYFHVLLLIQYIKNLLYNIIYFIFISRFIAVRIVDHRIWEAVRENRYVLKAQINFLFFSFTFYPTLCNLSTPHSFHNITTTFLCFFIFFYWFYIFCLFIVYLNIHLWNNNRIRLVFFFWVRFSVNR